MGVGERVRTVRVVAGGDEDPGRGEGLDDRAGHVLDGTAHDVAGRPGRDRKVDRQPVGGGTADLRGESGAGVEGPLVGGHVEDGGVVPEDVLGPVAVVDVPVEDRTTRSPWSVRRAAATATLFKRQKPIWWSAVSVMAGGAGDDEGGPVPGRTQRLDRGQARTGGEQRRCPGVGGGVGVGVEVPPTVSAELREVVEIGGGVDPGEVSQLRGAGGDVPDLAVEVKVVDPGDDRVDPGRSLGMALAVVDPVAGRPRHGQHGSSALGVAPARPPAVALRGPDPEAHLGTTSSLQRTVTSNPEPVNTSSMSWLSERVSARKTRIPLAHAASARTSRSERGEPTVLVASVTTKATSAWSVPGRRS